MGAKRRNGNEVLMHVCLRVVSFHGVSSQNVRASGLARCARAFCMACPPCRSARLYRLLRCLRVAQAPVLRACPRLWCLVTRSVLKRYDRHEGKKGPIHCQRHNVNLWYHGRSFTVSHACFGRVLAAYACASLACSSCARHRSRCLYPSMSLMVRILGTVICAIAPSVMFVTSLPSCRPCSIVCQKPLRLAL